MAKMFSKSLGDSGLAKASAKPTMKPVAQKGIMGKSGSLGAGEIKRPCVKGFKK